MRPFDVLVIGGGNAGLCAALSARHLAERVLVLERAPEHMRGGNTRHTRNIRCVHKQDTYTSGAYPEDEFFNDLLEVSGRPPNPELTKYVIRESQHLSSWMAEHGVAWQQPLAGTLHLNRTNRWFLGGGKALLNTYYRAAARMGIDVQYNAKVEDLIVDNNKCEAVSFSTGGDVHQIRARAVVVTAGGFEANLSWLKKYWGDAAENFVVRGTPYNDGSVLANLLTKGAKSVGDPKGVHAIAVDARAPKFDGGIVTRLDSIPFGIVVNQCGRRFYDEGENIWPKRYATWGRLIADQPGQLAYSIVDSKAYGRFVPAAFKPFRAESLDLLASQMGLEPGPLAETVRAYNQAVAGNTDCRMDKLDGQCTRNIHPPKSNWALPIDRPPFYGFPLRPGITFTYMGVAVDESVRVLDEQGRPFHNIFAAGEIMSGNILTKGYLAGFGLTIGSVIGQLAGRSAASYARV